MLSPNSGFEPGISGRWSDGQPRNEIPAHDVAKRLIEADAVHVDGQALRRAEQRRRGVAAIVDVRLKRIALNLVDVHAVEAAVQEVGEVEGAAALDRFTGRDLHRRRDLFDRQIDPHQRRGLDHGHRKYRLRERRRLRWGLRGCLRLQAHRQNDPGEVHMNRVAGELGNWGTGELGNWGTGAICDSAVAASPARSRSPLPQLSQFPSSPVRSTFSRRTLSI